MGVSKLDLKEVTNSVEQYYMQCPSCGDWGQIDNAQFIGEAPISCACTKFTENVNFLERVFNG